MLFVLLIRPFFLPFQSGLGRFRIYNKRMNYDKLKALFVQYTVCLMSTSAVSSLSAL